jgi:hypothetical protein
VTVLLAARALRPLAESGAFTVSALGVALLTLATAAVVHRAVRPQVLVLVAAGLVGLAVAELGTPRPFDSAPLRCCPGPWRSRCWYSRRVWS